MTGDDLCKAGKHTNNYQTSCLGGLLLGATALLAALHIVPLALKLENEHGGGVDSTVVAHIVGYTTLAVAAIDV